MLFDISIEISRTKICSKFFFYACVSMGSNNVIYFVLTFSKKHHLKIILLQLGQIQILEMKKQSHGELSAFRGTNEECVDFPSQELQTKRLSLFSMKKGKEG